MLRVKRPFILVVGVLLTAVIALIGAFTIHGQGTQAAPLDQDTAVRLAIQAAQRPMPEGWLATAPTEVRAKTTTFGAAYQLKNGRPVDASTKLGQDANRSIWLVVLRGDFTVPNEPAPGKPTVPPLSYHQGVVVLDASTGELLSIALYPPTHEIAVSALPQATIPTGGTTLSEPALSKPTDSPLPTRVRNGGATIPANGLPAETPRPPNGSATATPAR